MKKNLAVTFGGRTVEHDISIITANQLMHHADPDKYNVIPIYINRDGVWYTGEKLLEMKSFENFDEKEKGIKRVFLSGSSDAMLYEYGKKLKAVSRIDVAIPAMHGLHGEDGTIQGLFELSDIPYSSAGVAGSAAGMDKILMKSAFIGFGFPVLNSLFFERDVFFDDSDSVCGKVENSLGYPVFVKPANLGSSIGINRADDRGALLFALDVAFRYDRRVLVERAVTDIIEVNCSVLGNATEAIASVVEQPVLTGGFLNFEDKYLRNESSKGMKSLSRKIPADISEEMTKQVQQLSVDIFKALDLKGVVRIDFIIDQSNGKLYVNEVNTIPGSFAYYLWEHSGISFEELVDRLVAIAEKQMREKKRSEFAFDSKVLQKAATGLKISK
ncbi:MAG: D-alanine--D-alanine ligase family protein [Christensenellales bacterium]|jgi:D-alanine-D-alanine ligase